MFKNSQILLIVVTVLLVIILLIKICKTNLKNNNEGFQEGEQ